MASNSEAYSLVIAGSRHSKGQGWHEIRSMAGDTVVKVLSFQPKPQDGRDIDLGLERGKALAEKVLSGLNMESAR